MVQGEVEGGWPTVKSIRDIISATLAVLKPCTIVRHDFWNHLISHDSPEFSSMARRIPRFAYGIPVGGDWDAARCFAILEPGSLTVCAGAAHAANAMRAPQNHIEQL